MIPKCKESECLLTVCIWVKGKKKERKTIVIISKEVILICLCYSQSLSTLDIIEEFMSKLKVPRPDMDENWAKNKSYFRECFVEPFNTAV